MARRPPPILALFLCCCLLPSLFLPCDASIRSGGSATSIRRSAGRSTVSLRVPQREPQETYRVAVLSSMYRTRDGDVSFSTSKSIQTFRDDGPTTVSFTSSPLTPFAPPPPLPPAPTAPAMAPPSSSNATGRPRRGKLAKEFLTAHNKVRQQLNMPALKWDRKLARFARGWAAQLAATDCTKPRHSDGPYGENAFWGSGPDWKAADAVTAWANENVFYNSTNNSCLPGNDCGHYTQMIWRTSQRMGCERVNCPNGDTYITCNYDPPGNYVGETPFDLPH